MAGGSPLRQAEIGARYGVSKIPVREALQQLEAQAHRAFVAYDATKGGIEAMTRALTLDLGPYGVRINAIVPGAIDTIGLEADQLALRGVNVPMGRMGVPADLTGAAVFLASGDSLYVTGQRTVVDGSMLAQQRSATVDIMLPSDFPKVWAREQV